MKNTKKIFLIILSVFLINFSLFNSIQAGSLWDDQEGMKTDQGQIGFLFGNGSNNEQDVRLVVINVIKIFLQLLGLIFLVLLLLSGYKYMMARGDGNATNEALTGIRNAVVGLAIILMSYGVTLFVTKTLVETLK